MRSIQLEKLKKLCDKENLRSDSIIILHRVRYLSNIALLRHNYVILTSFR